nr:uncharacterized protein LOC122272377 [Parasteatoda tepidariorum]
MQTNNAENTHVDKIALKLPPFWRTNIKLWFLQVESAFTLSNITKDETKYASLIAHIDAETLSHVSDLLFSPPATNKYDALKERLITEFSDSENKRIRKLLSELQLGDQKPSLLLRQMREVATDSVTEDFLKTIWLQRLPPNVQSILSILTDQTLVKLALLADKILETSPTQQINSIKQNETETDLKSNSFVALQNQISELSLQVAKMSVQQYRRRSDSRGRTNSRTRNKSEERSLCFYHFRFGKDALKCKQPCSFNSGNE